MTMKITLNQETRNYHIEADKAELEITQISICANMAQIPKEMKEERKKSAEIEIAIDKALAQ